MYKHTGMEASLTAFIETSAQKGPKQRSKFNELLASVMSQY